MMEAVTGGHKPAGAVLARDAALGRISRTRRWIIVGAAALTAALAALASVLLPGKSLRAKSRVTAAPSARAAAPTRSSAPALPAPADAAQLGLQSPGQPPQAAPAPQPAPQQSAPQPAPAPAPSAGGGAVVSGGS
jgi:hypothetical protein